MGEVIGMSIGPQDNIAATAAVTAIRSPFGNEFLAPKTDTPASTFSGLRKNCDAIDKHALASCHSAPPLSSGAQRGTSQWVKRHAIKKARDQLRDPPHLMRLRMTPRLLYHVAVVSRALAVSHILAGRRIWLLFIP